MAEDEKVEGIVAELTSLQVAKVDGVVRGQRRHEQSSAAKYDLGPADHEERSSRDCSGRRKTTRRPWTTRPQYDAERSTGVTPATRRPGGVVLIDVKGLKNLGLDPLEYRSKKVVELNAARVEFLRIEAFGRTYDIARTANGWEQLRPTREPADASSVKQLLSRLGEAQASALLDPSAVPGSGVDPPAMTISLWQAGPLAKPALALAAPPQSPPRLVLQIGRADAVPLLSIHPACEATEP